MESSLGPKGQGEEEREQTDSSLGPKGQGTKDQEEVGSFRGIPGIVPGGEEVGDARMASSGRVVHSWSTEQSESSEEEDTAKTRKRKRKRAAKFAKERSAEGGAGARTGVGNIDFVSEKERTEAAAADARWKRQLRRVRSSTLVSVG